MTQEPLLRMEHIGKDYFGNRVLADVNLTLQRGEILGLVGENGAGKILCGGSRPADRHFP